MEEALRALILAAAPVTALAGGRVNWGAHPQGQPLPAVVLQVISDVPGLTHDGPDGLTEARVQADCYAASYGAAKGLARAVSAALHGHRDAGLRLVQQIGAQDLREDGTDEADRPFRVSMDFRVFWRAA